MNFFLSQNKHTRTYIYTHQIPAKSYILEIKLFTRIPLRNGVFWLNIAKFEINWCYRYYFNLFSNLRKESELRQYHCRNSTKVGERKIKSRREKFFIFGNGIATIPSAYTCCPGGCLKCECVQGKPNDVEKKKLAIVVMPLPKMGGKKKKWLPKSHVRN